MLDVAAGTLTREVPLPPSMDQTCAKSELRFLWELVVLAEQDRAYVGILCGGECVIGTVGGAREVGKVGKGSGESGKGSGDIGQGVSRYRARGPAISGKGSGETGRGSEGWADRLAGSPDRLLGSPDRLPGSRDPRTRARGYELLAHELAHTFDLHHCDHFACVMNGIADEQELDDLAAGDPMVP
jgi:hypothetical protein